MSIKATNFVRTRESDAVFDRFREQREFAAPGGSVLPAAARLRSERDDGEPRALVADCCEQRAYYCRECGGKLPEGSKRQFHPDCLRKNKQRRVAEQTRREAERRQAWLRRQHCPDCGASLAKLADADPQRPARDTCEASQSSQATPDSPGDGEDWRGPSPFPGRL
jgi:hypothetical protein